MTLQRIAQLLVELLMHYAHFGVSLLMWCDNIISLPAGVSGVALKIAKSFPPFLLSSSSLDKIAPFGIG
jgi:hypothetical protein